MVDLANIVEILKNREDRSVINKNTSLINKLIKVLNNPEVLSYILQKEIQEDYGDLEAYLEDVTIEEKGIKQLKLYEAFIKEYDLEYQEVDYDDNGDNTSMYYIRYYPKLDCFIRLSGWYSSYESHTLDEAYEVFPEVKIKVNFSGDSSVKLEETVTQAKKDLNSI